MYSLTNRSSNTLPFMHMPNQDYSKLVGISIPTLVDTPPRTPTSSTRTCSFAGPLSSHPVSPIDFSLPSTPIDGSAPGFYRQSSPLSAHRLERRLECERSQSRLSERAPPPVPKKEPLTSSQRPYAPSGLGLSTRTDDFIRSQMSNSTNNRHTMMESPTFGFDHQTPQPQVIHTYITPPSSTSPPNRPSFASRIFSRTFRSSSSNKRRSADMTPHILPDTPETSSSGSPHSPASEFSSQTKYRISSPMPLMQAQGRATPDLSKRDSVSSKHTLRASTISTGEAIPRMRRKKSVGNWLDAAKRKSGLWWGENMTANEAELDKENQTPPPQEDTHSDAMSRSSMQEENITVVDKIAPKLPELQQLGLRINGGKTGLAKVIGDIGR